MKEPKSIAAVYPALSSPGRLLLSGFVVLAAVWFIQLASDIPVDTTFSPVELSSNVVAAMGVVWALLQYRTYRRDAVLRKAWVSMACGMALLGVEGNIGELLLMQSHDPDEMGLSIGLWFVAAYLIFRGGRLFAPRRSVMAVFRTGFLLQLVAQYLGWLGAMEQSDVGAAHSFQYLNEMGELAAVLAYLFAMLLAEFAPLKSYRFPISSIGRKGREFVRDFQLLDTTRFPTRNRLLRSFPIRDGVIVAIGVWHLLRVAPHIARDGGPTVIRQAVDLVFLGFRGVNPHSYYLLELFRQGNRAAVDEFVTRVETKNGLTRLLQAQAKAPDLEAELNDKLVFTRICHKAGLPAAPILASVEDGGAAFYADHAAFDRDLLVKQRRGRGGKLTLEFERVRPLIYRDARGELFSLDLLAMRLAVQEPDRPLIIQPKLGNHDSISFLAKDSLLVFRVVTCLDQTGEPQVTHGLLRIMRRFEPTWPAFPEKEWGAAIRLENGELGALAGDVPATCMNWYVDHPVTGRAVQGVVVERWKEIAEVAVRAHRVFAGCAVVGWDIALTPDGVQILEGNSNMDFNFIQRCYRASVGQSSLGELLSPYVDGAMAAEMQRFEAR